MKLRYIALILSIMLLVSAGIFWANSQTGKQDAVSDQKNSADVVLNPKEIIRLTNEYRATKGLAPLVENEKLNKSACLKLQDMVDNNYADHTSPTGVEPWHWFSEAGYSYSNAGENLAYGFPSDESLVKGWIKSPTHEANLSGEYAEIGVCSRANKETGVRTSLSANTTIAHYATPYSQ